jgi:hypothetical protein
MKCPECGFEYLDGDEECLACGVHLASAAENKEKERIRAVEANERKERYDIELKKELGLIPADDDDAVEPGQGKTLQDVFKKKPSCPKCGAERHPEALECIRCGVIFDKYKFGSNGFKTERTSTPLKTEASPVVPPPQWTDREDDKTDEIDLARLDQLLTESNPETFDGIDQPLEMESRLSTDTSGPVIEIPATMTMSNQTRDVQGPDVQPDSLDNKKAAEKTSNKVDGAPRFKIRTPQKSETTWEIYQRKAKARIDSFATGVKSMWNSFESHCGGRVKALRNVGILTFVLFLIVSSPMIYSFSIDVISGFQVKAEQKRQKEVQLNFFSHRDDITNRITKNITERQLDSAEKEIAALDIPALKNELRPLKNYLSEIRISEEADRIPESNYDKKFEAYSQLVELNFQNETYRSKREEYRLKFADNEYIKAIGYYNKGKKDPNLLDKSIKTIKKSVDLFPDSNKYKELKSTLIKQKLLFYEGNDKIAMAVRDDGMGKRLFSDQRKLSVWLVNKSQETVYINVQYFTMVGKNGLNYTYNDTGSRLSGKIEPGQQTWGELYFRTSTSPAKLTFNHLVCGKISRDFP